jgi:hypothetical protein
LQFALHDHHHHHHHQAREPSAYPMVNVRDIESGKVRATRELFGAD